MRSSILSNRRRPWRGWRSRAAAVLLGLLAIGVAHAAWADNRDRSKDPDAPAFLTQRGTGLLIPAMNARRGRLLFLRKGCVACHSVNGVGGVSAPRLDADPKRKHVSVFEFAARMWRGAETMIDLQKLDQGYQVGLTADELADLTAFASDYLEQRKLSDADIPPNVRRWMKEMRL